MKKTSALVLAVSLMAGSRMAIAQQNFNDNSLEVKGTVQRLLVNPEGDVDGFLLEDGTQVNFPPHMSSQLTAVVAPKDRVDIRGFRENAKIFKAEKITNVKTSKSVAEVPPQVGPDDAGMAPSPPPPAPGAPKGPPAGPLTHEGLKQLTANGKIQSQIFGRRGEVSGVILSDNSIVRFGPRWTEDASVKTDVGQSLKASGFGTQNSYGKSIEATELSNK